MKRGNAIAIFGAAVADAALRDPAPMPALSAAPAFQGFADLMREHANADLPTVRLLVAGFLAGLSARERLAVVRLTVRGVAGQLGDVVRNEKN